MHFFPTLNLDETRMKLLQNGRPLILGLFLGLSHISGFSQTILEGFVMDRKGNTMIGASVYLKNTWMEHQPMKTEDLNLAPQKEVFRPWWYQVLVMRLMKRRYCLAIQP